MLVEMRHAPDPRLLLEVALVQLTHEAAANDVGALMDRLDRLEQAVAQRCRGRAAAPPPVDPATGRVQLGGRARRDATDAAPRPTASTAAAPTLPSRRRPARPLAPQPPAPRRAAPRAARRACRPAAGRRPAAGLTGQRRRTGRSCRGRRGRSTIVPSLKPFVRSIYSVPRLLGVRDGALTLGAPNDAHRAKCEQHRAEVEAAAAVVVGGPVPSRWWSRRRPHQDDHDDEPPRDTDRGDGSPTARVVPLHPAGPPPADDDIDLHDLVDAPPDTVVSPIDRLAQAFPGSELIDERR